MPSKAAHLKKYNSNRDLFFQKILADVIEIQNIFILDTPTDRQIGKFKKTIILYILIARMCRGKSEKSLQKHVSKNPKCIVYVQSRFYPAVALTHD